MSNILEFKKKNSQVKSKGAKASKISSKSTYDKDGLLNLSNKDDSSNNNSTLYTSKDRYKVKGDKDLVKDNKKNKKKIDPVLLGYQDDFIESEHYDPWTSKIGGRPDWLLGKPPNFAYKGLCSSCSKPLYLILQIYAPLENSVYDRTLYLFACIYPSCIGSPGSVKVVRALKTNLEYMEKIKQKEKRKIEQENRKKITSLKIGNLWENAFCEEKNEIQLNNQTAEKQIETSINTLSDDLRKLNIMEKEDQNVWENSLKTLPSFFIATEIEDFSHNLEGLENEGTNDDLALRYKDLIDQYQSISETKPQGDSTLGDITEEGGLSWAGEQYEKAEWVPGVDKTFLYFSDRVSLNPDQILRYDHGGIPMLYTRMGAVADLLLGIHKENSHNVKRNKLPINVTNLPKCELCNADRVFEFQVVPKILSILPFQDFITNEESNSSKSKKDMILGYEGWEFGTILVFTCEKNCPIKSDPNGDGYSNELALIQLEP